MKLYYILVIIVLLFASCNSNHPKTNNYPSNKIVDSKTDYLINQNADIECLNHLGDSDYVFTNPFYKTYQNYDSVPFINSNVYLVFKENKNITPDSIDETFKSADSIRVFKLEKNNSLVDVEIMQLFFSTSVKASNWVDILRQNKEGYNSIFIRRTKAYEFEHENQVFIILGFHLNDRSFIESLFESLKNCVNG